MALVNVRAPPNVVPATENYFALIRPEPSKGVIRLIRHIAGPQEIELEVLTEAYLNSTFYSTEVFKFGIFVDWHEFWSLLVKQTAESAISLSCITYTNDVKSNQLKIVLTA